MRTDLYTYRVLIIAQKQLHFSFLYWTQAANIHRQSGWRNVILSIYYYSLGKKGWGWDFRGRNAGAVTCSSFYPPVPSLLPFFLLLFLSLSSQLFLILAVFSHNMLISLSICSLPSSSWRVASSLSLYLSFSLPLSPFELSFPSFPDPLRCSSIFYILVNFEPLPTSL